MGNPGRRYQRGREEGQRGQEGEEKRGEGFRRGQKRRMQAAQTPDEDRCSVCLPCVSEAQAGLENAWVQFGDGN